MISTPQSNTAWARRRRSGKPNRLEAIQRQSSKTRLLSLGLKRSSTTGSAGQFVSNAGPGLKRSNTTGQLVSNAGDLSKSSSSPCVVAALTKELQAGAAAAKPTNVRPRRHSSLSRLGLLTKIPTLLKDDSLQPQDVVVLPERTLISGKGSERSFVRRVSERNLVKKISQSIHNELSNHGNTSQHNDDSFSFRQGSTKSFTFEDSMDSIKLDWNEVQGATVHSSNAKPLPPIHRKEVLVGGLLGQGAFSKVMAVQGIQLMSPDEFDRRKQQLQCPETPTEEMTDVLASLESRQQLAQAYPIPSDTTPDASTAKSLVVKHLNRKLLRKPKHFQQAAFDLAREAQILASLDCDHIIQLRAMSLGGTAALDSGRFNDFFLVLDRLDDTLDARILRWKENVTSRNAGVFHQATRYALELASALDYLHERRIVFRDTKPQNVGFLALGGGSSSEEPCPKERLQLFDFGLCRSLPQNTEEPQVTEDNESSLEFDQQGDHAVFHMSIAGTTRYMSPEMQLQEAYNCKTDVYSWAMTFYEMLSLRKPYGEIMRSHQFQEFICEFGKRPFLGDLGLPESIEQVLKEAWCASIPDRLSIRQVKERLEAILISTASS